MQYQNITKDIQQMENEIINSQRQQRIAQVNEFKQIRLQQQFISMQKKQLTRQEAAQRFKMLREQAEQIKVKREEEIDRFRAEKAKQRQLISPVFHELKLNQKKRAGYLAYEGRLEEAHKLAEERE